MDRFSKFTREERDLLSVGLINQAEEFVKYGLNGFNEQGKMEYLKIMALIDECDKERKYYHMYKDFPRKGDRRYFNK